MFRLVIVYPGYVFQPVLYDKSYLIFCVMFRLVTVYPGYVFQPVLYDKSYLIFCVMFRLVIDETTEMFYLMTYSTHFKVNDYSDSERKPAAAIWAIFSD